MRGREEDAWKVMGKMHATLNAREDEYLQKEMFQMTRQMELDRTLPSSWLEMFRRPSYRKRMGIAVFTVFACQASGSQVIAIYSTTLFEQLGFSPTRQLFLFAGEWTSNLFFSTACIFYIDKFPRPRMIAFGLCILMTATICYTALAANYIDSTNRAGQIAAVSMTYIFLAGYSATVEGPFYFYGAELFPTHLRAKGIALQATTFSWTSIMWAQSGSTAISTIGWKYFVIFIVLTFVSAIIIFFWFPDTNRKTLEEVAALFGDEDLVVVYQQDIHIDAEHHKITATMNNVPGAEGTETITTVSKDMVGEQEAIEMVESVGH
jgi:MFS family permease